jgi:penicillin V acylase-like amidase (Ntn superfamily)
MRPLKVLTPTFLLALGVLSVGLDCSPSQACTRFLWNNNKLGVFVARTMDWPESTLPVLTVFPRGLARDGGKVGPEIIVKDNPARWTSKYGSLVTTIYGIGTIDGLNEKGLGIHMLYLYATDFGPRDISRPAVHAGLWAQYLLDNTSTVDEALKALEAIQIVMVEAHGHKANIHMAIEDVTGGSAIVEYIGGKPVIHHGRQFQIMTNDPTYDQQLELLKQHDFSHPSSDTPLPGNVRATDRFQRVAYYAAILPDPKNEREAVASSLAIVRNVSVPFGAPYKGFGIYNTEYRTVSNLTQQRYYFELTTIPNVIWADLNKFDLAPGSPVRALNPDNIDLSGDVSDKFQKQERSPF